MNLFGDEKNCRRRLGRAVLSFYRGRLCEGPAVSIASLLENPHKILIIPELCAGGLFLGAPKFRAIRNRYPRAEVSLLTDARREYIAREMPFVDDVILCNDFVVPVGARLRDLGERLQRREFDIALCFGSPESFRPAYLCYRSGGKLRVGFHTEDVPFFNFRIVPQRDVRYEADRLSLLLRTLDIAEGDGKLGWSASPEGAGKVLDRYLGGRRDQERLVGIDTSSGIGPPLSFRQWQTIVRAVDETYRAVIFFDFEQRHVANRLKETLGQRALLFQTDDLPRTVALMEACDGFIAGNTDLFHLAVTIGLPTVGILSEGDIPRWAPADERHVRVVGRTRLKEGAGAQIVGMLSEMQADTAQRRS